jgi:hypothetical protein
VIGDKTWVIQYELEKMPNSPVEKSRAIDTQQSTDIEIKG